MSEKPVQKQHFELDDLLLACEHYIEHIASGDACDDTISDHKQWIFETAITAFYGNDVFTWINSKIT